MSSPRPRGVHLVGSVPLASTEEVLRTVAAALGDRLRRLPDGEIREGAPEERNNWIMWQRRRLADTGAFDDHGDVYFGLSLKPDGVERLRFGDLGYAAAAERSYELFTALKREGAIPADLRFQVSVPTPLAPVSVFVRVDDHEAVEPAYEAALLAELDRMAATVPPGRLAVQWDVAIEFGMLEGVLPCWFDDVEAGILERLVRYGERVPTGVELGYHLCYGDPGHRHFVEPADTTRLVRVANTLARRVSRPIDFVHLPVPRDRDDDAYFAPLADLTLAPGTELYLGLVHHTGGLEGTERRVAAASRVVDRFGVATECGFGRRPPEQVPELLAIHAAVSDPHPDAQPG